MISLMGDLSDPFIGHRVKEISLIAVEFEFLG